MTENFTVRRLEIAELPILTELFSYRDVDDMVQKTAGYMQKGYCDIFVLFREEELLGEIHVGYCSTDEAEAEPGKRAYLFAYRIKKGHHNKGLGTFLLRRVLSELESQGYTEFTIGVEDDNEIAKHIYNKFGFREMLGRRVGQDDEESEPYEYNLLLRRKPAKGDCKMGCKLLLFDLDGTLLRSDKTISERTLAALLECRKQGIWIGVSTSRGRQNMLSFLGALEPDILITSGGALVEYGGQYIFQTGFSGEETRRIIAVIREVCGADCEITVDTVDSHYWNYKIDPKKQDQSWGDSIYTDFTDFDQDSLKICAEIFNKGQAERLRELLSDCDCIRFSDGYWYKFTKKGITKERAIKEVCAACGIGTEDIFAFGDDYADIGMLRLCGKGIAMENAIDKVKVEADLVIGSNDKDGIAEYLERYIKKEQ